MATQPEQPRRPRVVIIGAGFGGLFTARALVNAPVDVVLLDRNNYHAFWPLMYQVATAGLEPQDIVQPVRALVRDAPNIQFRVATVQGVDFDNRIVKTEDSPIPYDELVISAGSTNNFFGLKEIEENGFGFKEMTEAMAIRNHIISRFEHAENVSDPERRRRLLTFVIIGGGPTGVELAGATAELIKHVMRRDHPRLDFSKVRVILIEMMDRILLTFPESLSKRATRTLTRLGVDVRTNTAVAGMKDGVLQLKDGSTIDSETVIWAAGVQGAELATVLGLELQRGQRIRVTPELQLPERSEVWIIGDMAYLEGPDGKPYPMLAAVAMQQGRHVARNIRRKLTGQPLLRFRYVDKGTMATVGRRSAVARIWNMNFSGAVAWYLWLGVHLLFLIGFRNRFFVLLSWAYNYFTFDRAARAVLVASRHARALTEVEEVINRPVASRQPERVR